ncbi:unnamed protein product [Auanema sp. JU1783]|nr:unnamed protein product [Auanema sp. JU1783]
MFTAKSPWAFTFRQVFARAFPQYRRKWTNFRSVIRLYPQSNNRSFAYDRRLLLAFTSAAGFSFKDHGISDERINTAEERRKEFDLRNEKEEGWEPLVIEENFRAFRRHVPGPYEMYEYKCAGTYFDISPQTFLDAQNDLDYRKEWDSNIISLDLLKDQDEHELIKWVAKYPYPLYPREYVYVRRTWVSDDEKVVVVESEVVYPSASDSKNVRVGTYTSRMAIRAHKDWENHGTDYILIYFDNPEANIPKYIYNWIIDRGGPYFLKQVHAAALEIQNSGRTIKSTMDKMRKLKASRGDHQSQFSAREDLCDEAEKSPSLESQTTDNGTQGYKMPNKEEKEEQNDEADDVPSQIRAKIAAVVEQIVHRSKEEEIGLSHLIESMMDRAHKVSRRVCDIPKGF